MIKWHGNKKKEKNGTSVIAGLQRTTKLGNFNEAQIQKEEEQDTNFKTLSHPEKK